jgi:predicted DNA-binding transcriptional regulator YafY
MPRNAEVIRQWNVLRTIEAARLGVSIADLAALSGVTTRTIRRDLEALQQAGFTLYDEKDEGRTRWRLSEQPFSRLRDTGFTLPELCALYFSRSLLECLAGTPFHDDLRHAFDKLEAVLPPRMRQFLDRLPAVFSAKAGPTRRLDPNRPEVVARLLEATLHRRRASMRYHSFSSGQVKTYVIEPYRLVYNQGGLYLFGYVPEYGEMRTFAVERIEQLSLLEETFELDQDFTPELFAHSLGVHQGRPESVEIEFSERITPYIRERLWHPSQRIADASGGAIRVTLDVSTDWALRTWILGFGPLARVIAPPSLVAQILDDIERARRQYVEPDPPTRASR